MSQSAFSSSSLCLSAAMSLVSYVKPPSLFTTVSGTETLGANMILRPSSSSSSCCRSSSATTSFIRSW